MHGHGDMKDDAWPQFWFDQGRNGSCSRQAGSCRRTHYYLTCFWWRSGVYARWDRDYDYNHGGGRYQIASHKDCFSGTDLVETRMDDVADLGAMAYAQRWTEIAILSTTDGETVFPHSKTEVAFETVLAHKDAMCPELYVD